MVKNKGKERENVFLHDVWFNLIRNNDSTSRTMEQNVNTNMNIEYSCHNYDAYINNKTYQLEIMYSSLYQ